jgi:hypothetical protein
MNFGLNEFFLFKIIFYIYFQSFNILISKIKIYIILIYF